MNQLNIDPENFDPVGKHTLEVISGAGRFNKWMYSEIKPFLKGDILEIGSGIGNISQYVIKDGYNITLSDYNPGYHKYLQENFSSTTNVKEILQLDLLHPDFENFYAHLEEMFDSIILSNVIEHLNNDSEAVKNCRHLLKPNGHLIVLAPAYQWLYCNLDKELGHYRRYTLKKMQSLLLNEKLEIIRSKHFNVTGIMGWLWAGKMLGRKILGTGEMKTFEKIVPLAKLVDKIVFKKIGLSLIIIGIKK